VSDNFLVGLFLFMAGIFFGIIIATHLKVSDMRMQERLFENCLVWKKDFDLCRKEFMPS